jgi:hypothetical protein
LSRRYQKAGRRVGTTAAEAVIHARRRSSTHTDDYIQSWALMNLVPLVAKWHGQAEGERAHDRCCEY